MVRRYSLIGTEYGSARAFARGDQPSLAWNRRDLLRTAGAVLAAAGGAALLTGGPSAAAAPTSAAASPTVVTVVPDASVTTVEAELIEQAIRPLLAANPGLDVKMFPQQLGGSGGALETFMVAGVGPDIFGDYILTGYVAANLALDLTPFVKRDNVDMSGFMQGQLLYIQQSGLQSPTNPNGLYALPCTGWPNATAVNLGMLDDLGLKYPDPSWTYRDWARLWQSTTHKAVGSRPPRTGLGVGDMWDGYDWGYGNVSPWVLWGWGGEYVNPTDSGRSYLDAPQTIAAGEWAWDLFWTGAISTSVNDADFVAGNVASINQSPGDLATAAEKYGGLKWDFFDMPVWPARKTSYTSSNFDGIWAGTKHPDAAWTVLKWFTMSPAWQRLQMRTLLYVPSRAEQYPEWVRVVEDVMPPLRSKNMGVYLRQAQENTMYTGLLYRYSSNQAKTIVAKLSSDLGARRVSVAEGFSAAARQINALEGIGRAELEVTGRQLAVYEREIAAARSGGTAYRFPAPPRTGAGVPPVNGRAEVRGAAGTWSVQGGGSGVNGGGTGATFAGAAVTAATGTFVCRITAITAVRPAGKLNDGAKFGLMACGDLSSAAANVGIEVAAGRGVHFHGIPFANGPMGDQHAGTAPGLLAASVILLPDSQPAKNYLVRPVWFKLERSLTSWTAATSLDGVAWQPAGVAEGAQMAGCWVGLYVTAHGSGDLAQATFDNVQGFTPATFVRIGAP